MQYDYYNAIILQSCNVCELLPNPSLQYGHMFVDDFFLFFMFAYVCCMKPTADVSSTTGPLYQNISPVSNVTKTSNFEMKDNQAYGVVTTSTISTRPVYEIMS